MTKRFSFLWLCLSVSAALYSLPQQGAVVSGKAEIVQKNDLLQITTSDRAILSWDAFSVGKAETLQFLQPSDRSAVLNRVTGFDVSRLDGSLQANGQVYLINPNGLIIGKDAVINTAGFVGTTLQIPDVDFLSNTDLLFQGDSTASIIHLGTIQSSQGPVTLIAHKIENEGKIEANGAVSLLAGHEILLNPLGDLLHVRAEIQADGIESNGVIQAFQTKIASDGACSLGITQGQKPDAMHFVAVGGKILLRAENAPLAVSGELTAAEGTVHLLGNTVHLKNGTVVDTSGANGGGEILVGGDYRGLNPDIPNALVTVVDENVLLKADATINGKGGKVIVWSDQATMYSGQSYVRGGKEGGDGGFTEVSGKFLDFLGFADSSATLGKTGTLLLDPIDVTISTGANSNVTALPPPPPAVANPYTILYTGTPAVINTTALVNALGVNDVIVDATQAGAGGGSITVSNNVIWATAQALTLKADTAIAVNATISNTSATTGFTAITLTNSGVASATQYTGVTIGATGALLTDGGNISVTGTGFGIASNFAIGVNIDSGGQITSTGAGNVAITGTGGSTTAGGGNYGIWFQNAVSFVGTGNVTLTGTGGSSPNGQNAGVIFANTVVLSGVNCTITGKGGIGGAAGPDNYGVNSAAGSISLGSNTSLNFLNCTGGSGGTGTTDNGGVFLNGSIGAISTADDFITLSFNNIKGGNSTSGAGEGNYGIFSPSSIQLPGTHSSITLSDIYGGDIGSAASSFNIGFGCDSSLVAATITGSNIFGGGGTNSPGIALTFSGVLGENPPTYSFPVNVNLTGTGGGSSTGTGNSGIQIESNYSIIAASGGTINLTGTGGGLLDAASGNNVGVLIAIGVAQQIDLNNGATLSLTGTGGLGNTANNPGVKFPNLTRLTLLDGSTLLFIGCQGGTSSIGGNHGVDFEAAFTILSDDALSQVLFENCTGGTEGGGNNGVNFGSTSNLSLPNASITFSNITGGDAGNATFGNAGVSINTGAIVSSPNITATNIKSGAALSDNYGFQVLGTLGNAAAAQNISITALGAGSGSNNAGIFVSGTVETGGAGTINLSGTTSPVTAASPYGVIINGATAHITGITGPITLLSPSSSMLLENASTITSTTGAILLKADVNISDPVGVTISSTGGGAITLVVDNAFPTPPGVGSGVFNIPNTVLTTTLGADLKLYGGVPNTGTFPATLNGAAYVPLLHQEDAIWFPGGVYPVGVPYFIYYKIVPPAVVSKAVYNFSIAIAEAFQTWAYEWYRDYLDQDRYPPAYTPKGMNIAIPSLVYLYPETQQTLFIQPKEKPRLVPWMR